MAYFWSPSLAWSTLAALGALVGHLPDQPLVDVVPGPQVLRIELPGLLGDVHHDGARLEDHDRLAAAFRLVVDHHRHAMVGVHLEELFAELIAAADVDGYDLVGQAAFLEQDGDLLAVGRGPVMQVDHG